MPDSITITLPLPPKELSPNARCHWARRAKATKQYRAHAFAASFRCSYGWKTATCRATFFFRYRRRRDRDNLLASLKAAFDGLTDAGVIADDSGLTHLPVEIEIDKCKPRVELTITRSEA